MLELSDITVKTERKTWLRDISLSVDPGVITGVIGARGSGKTELVRAIMGLIETDSGTITLEGRELGYGDRQNFGYLPAERGGYPHMKVMEQIVYFARLHGMTLGAAERNAVTLLARLDLSDRAYAPLHNLSGSEVACVEIASVIAADPDVVVLDEPFTGLDMKSADLVLSLLRDHAESGVPVIFTSDDWDQTQLYADQVVVLSHGEIVEHDDVEALRKKGKPTYRAEFVNEKGAKDAEAALAEIVSGDFVRKGSIVEFQTSDINRALNAVNGLSGLRNFTTQPANLEELFKERV